MLIQVFHPFDVYIQPAIKNSINGRWRSTYTIKLTSDGTIANIGDGGEFDDRDMALVDAFSLALEIAHRKVRRG